MHKPSKTGGGITLLGVVHQDMAALIGKLMMINDWILEAAYFHRDPWSKQRELKSLAICSRRWLQPAAVLRHIQ